MIIGIDKGVVRVNGKVCEPGWLKGWLFENVYGWEWVGPWRGGGSFNLLVLNHEPNRDERKEIEARFADAVPPNGEPELVP